MVKRPVIAHSEAGFLQLCVTVRYCRGERPQKPRKVEGAAEGWRLLLAPALDFVLPLSEPVDLQRLHLRSKRGGTGGREIMLSPSCVCGLRPGYALESCGSLLPQKFSRLIFHHGA